MLLLEWPVSHIALPYVSGPAPTAVYQDGPGPGQALTPNVSLLDDGYEPW